MSAFDPRIWALAWFITFGVVFVVRGFSMLEAFILLGLFAAAVFLAAVKITKGPTDFSGGG
jgi:hypothetical protein